VTLACDSIDNLSVAVDRANVTGVSFVSPYLGLGAVGVCGSVLQTGGWGLFPLPK
jgi:hypothetical protein